MPKPKRSNPHTAEGTDMVRGIIVICCLGLCCVFVFLARGALAQNVESTSEIPMIAVPASQPATPVTVQPVLAQPAAPQSVATVTVQPALTQPTAPQPATPVTAQPTVAMTATAPATSPSTEKPVASAATPVATPANSVSTNSADEVLPKSLFISAEASLQISNAIADYRKSLLPPEEREKIAAQNPLLPGAAAHSESVKGAKVNTTSFARGAVDKGTTFPQFFMESLVYHSPEDWVVRVNGKRISSDKPADEEDIVDVVVVVAIDRDKALLRWKPFNMGRVNEVWDNLPHTNNTQSEAENTPTEMVFSNKKILDKVPDVTVLVDKEKGEVVFTLRPNQTFSSFVMRTLEGKVVPVRFKKEQKAADVDELKTTKVGEPKAEVNVDGDSETGLGSLMKNLEKSKESDGSK